MAKFNMWKWQFLVDLCIAIVFGVASFKAVTLLFSTETDVTLGVLLWIAVIIGATRFTKRLF